jgi:N-acetyl-gamma-glutamyl-phosphate reductase
MIKAAIVGASGYTGGELVRLLLQHPEVVITNLYSTTKGGQPVTHAHPDLLGQTDLHFSDSLDADLDVIFLCLGHGNSKAFLEKHSFADHTHIIDLSNDFRLTADRNFQGREFVYGLPELQKEAIKNAKALANPGCFATAIQLALLPLAQNKGLKQAVHVNAVTGSTGAGVKPSATTHFSWRNQNVSWYKPFNHQHLGEIGQSLEELQGSPASVLFLPQRGNFSRGIFATAYTPFEGTLEEAQQLYQAFYEDAAFTHVSGEPIGVKQVVNTNQCHLHLHKHEDVLLVTSCIDNLLKGASGQAVQNLNLMFGLAEKTGLQLKSIAF